MTKKGKISLVVSLSAAVVLMGAAAAAAVMCKKIYEKKYFEANV